METHRTECGAGPVMAGGMVVRGWLSEDRAGRADGGSGQRPANTRSVLQITDYARGTWAHMICPSSKECG